MKKSKVVFDFVKFSVPEKIGCGRRVGTRLTNNERFENPDIALPVIIDATNLLEVRFVSAQNGGRQETILLRQAEEQWDTLMRKQAQYVDRIADGDSAAILSAGFNIAKQSIPGQRPEFSVELTTGVSGSVELRRQSIPGAKSYIWQYCKDTLPNKESDWIVGAVTTKASVSLNGLTPLSIYWFRVAGVTSQGTLPYSTPMMQSVV